MGTAQVYWCFSILYHILSHKNSSYSGKRICHFQKVVRMRIFWIPLLSKPLTH